jgi:hypothetical protein
MHNKKLSGSPSFSIKITHGSKMQNQTLEKSKVKFLSTEPNTEKKSMQIFAFSIF